MSSPDCICCESDDQGREHDLPGLALSQTANNILPTVQLGGHQLQQPPGLVRKNGVIGDTKECVTLEDDSLEKVEDASFIFYVFYLITNRIPRDDGDSICREALKSIII